MIRTFFTRCLPLASALALLATIALAAPAYAQTASCSPLAANEGPAGGSMVPVGGAGYSVGAYGNFEGGNSGSDAEAQSACQNYAQTYGVSGVCQDGFNYGEDVQYIDPSLLGGNGPYQQICQVEICALGGSNYSWAYAFYPNVTSLAYVAPVSVSNHSYNDPWDTDTATQTYSDANVCTYTAPPSPPTAAISANPTTIVQGAGSTLSWSSTNASSCTGTNFSTGGATGGSVAVSPSTSTAYYVTCSGSGGSAQANTTVTVQPPPAPPANLTATCSVDGAHVSFSWSGGASNAYYPRIVTPTSAQCTSFGWQVYSDGATCLPSPDNGFGGATSITNFPITPGQQYTFWVQDVYQGVWSSPASKTFTCSGLADLTASVGSTVTGTPGASVTYTGTVTNSGIAATTGSFENLLQICNNTSCSGYDNISNEVLVSQLGNGASAPLSITASLPPSSGSYVYRYCANNNTSWQNSVAESNTGNDCSGWQTATVTAAVPTCSITASPSSIDTGQTSTITWTSTNTTSTTGLGFSTSGAPSGSVQVTPSSLPASYDVTCTGSGGTTTAPPATVSNICAAGGLSMNVSASPTTVSAGETSTVTWSAANVQSGSCTLVGTDGTNKALSVASCGVGGSQSFVISNPTTYTFTCDGSSKTVTVKVVPNFQEF